MILGPWTGNVNDGKTVMSSGKSCTAITSRCRCINIRLLKDLCRGAIAFTATALTLATFLVTTLTLLACSASPQPETAKATVIGAQAAGDKANPMSLELLFRTSHCGTVDASQWISSEPAFARLYQSTRRAVISPSASQLPAVNFSRYGVLLLSMGQQRSGGYAIELAAKALQVENSVAVLRINWQEPRPGMMVTQALTRPCVFIKVPRGEFRTLRVLDQHDTLRAELTVN